MSGTTLPVLIPIQNLPAATTPLGAADLLIVEQGGFAKTITASNVLPGGTVEANLFYAGPSTGSAAIAEFRAIAAADIPGTLDSTVIDGTLNASALLVDGNSVITKLSQGTLNIYGGITIGSNLTLDAGGTLSAAGGGAGSGTVDLGTANQIAYYPSSAAEVGGATYVSVGSGAAAGILVLGQASTRSGGVIMWDAGSVGTGTLTLASNLLALIGGDNASTIDGTGLVLTAGNATSTGNGGDIFLTVGTTSGGSRGGQLRVLNVPTADSAVANSVWWNNGVLVQTGHTATAAATITTAGALSGGPFVGSGTIGLAVSTGLTISAAGTIANSGVLSVDTASGAILIGAGLQRSSQTISVKPATTAALGGIIVGANLTVDGSGTLSVTAAGITAIIAGPGITTDTTTTNGTITTSGTLTATHPAVSQTGTAYAIAATDRASLINFSNTASIAVTIAQAGAPSFSNGFFLDIMNQGSGTLTLTPTTSTINGTTKLMLVRGQGARVVSDGSNYFALPSSLIAAVPSSTPTTPAFVSGWLDGLTRGANAIDIQPSRTVFTYASGANSIAFGTISTASADRAIAIGNIASAGGTDSTSIGSNNNISGFGPSSIAAGHSNVVSTGGTGRSAAIGYGNTVSGSNSAAVGSGNSAGSTANSFVFAFGYQINLTGSGSVGLGTQATDRGNAGAMVCATVNLGGSSSALGHTQFEDYQFVASTTGSSAVRLTTTGAAAAAANVGALGTFQAASVTVEIIITNFTTGKTATFYLAQSLLEKGANNAATTFTANGGGVTAGPASSGVFTLGANPTVTADTTNGGLNISYTPPAANTDTFYAEALVRYVTLRNN